MGGTVSTIIIAGSRDWTDRELIKLELNRVVEECHDREPITVVTGGARGADTIGHDVAVDAGHATTVMFAKWDMHGNSAGYKRNVEMAKVSTHLLAFWDGHSRGTMHMINIARERGLNVRVIREGQ